MNVNYSQKARNLMKRLNVISKEVNETFKQFHKETGNKYRTKNNLTIVNMNALKKPTPLEMSNENFNAYVASLSPEEQKSNTTLTLKALRRNRFKKTRSGERMMRQSEIAEAIEKNKIKLAESKKTIGPPPVPKSVIDTIMKNSFKPENFSNFNPSINLKGQEKTKYYKELGNLKKKALKVFENKQKRIDLVKGKKLSRSNATNIVQGSKLNLK